MIAVAERRKRCRGGVGEHRLLIRRERLYSLAERVRLWHMLELRLEQHREEFHRELIMKQDLLTNGQHLASGCSIAIRREQVCDVLI